MCGFGWPTFFLPSFQTCVRHLHAGMTEPPCWDDYSQSDMPCFKDLSSAVRERLTCWTVKRHFNQRHLHNAPLRITLLMSSAVNLSLRTRAAAAGLRGKVCRVCEPHSKSGRLESKTLTACAASFNQKKACKRSQIGFFCWADFFSSRGGGGKEEMQTLLYARGGHSLAWLMFLGIRVWLESCLSLNLQSCGIICFVSHRLQSSCGPTATQRHLAHIWSANRSRLQPIV